MVSVEDGHWGGIEACGRCGDMSERVTGDVSAATAVGFLAIATDSREKGV